MDRVLASEARGCWFDPSRAHQLPPRRLRTKALISLVAKHFGRRRTQVRIKTGSSGRLKLVQIDA